MIKASITREYSEKEVQYAYGVYQDNTCPMGGNWEYFVERLQDDEEFRNYRLVNVIDWAEKHGVKI